jgi:hypothetical protein
LRSQPEDDDRPNRSALCFGGVCRVKRIFWIKLEFVNVADDAASPIKETQTSPFLSVVQDCGVATLHYLITALAFSGVVETAVILPAINVAVTLSPSRV